jgi:hypothetical protein
MDDAIYNNINDAFNLTNWFAGARRHERDVSNP